MENKTNFKSLDDLWTRNLLAMYKNQCHADVTLICEGKKILVNRSVLASLSPLFSQLLLGCDSHVEPVIFLEGFSYKPMVCLVNYLYNGIAEGSSVDLVTVSTYAKELQVKGLVKLHGKEQFQVEILEKRKVEEQLQKLQSHEIECDSDSSSNEDEDLQIIYENVQESLPTKTDDSNENLTKNTVSSEINSKRKRQISQCSTHTEKKIILEPIPESSNNSKSAVAVKALKCSICKETFNAKTELRSHLGIHHSEQLTCSICGKLFTSRITLKRHLRRHISSLDGLLGSLSQCQLHLNEPSDNIAN
ncbi:zinc finger and BTB domain-containing protein 18-like [Daphnia pulex]|uniref:zinc finger and BTB domain-containing protein 18-like n=1 Tax=Daphnia pulex TaxID=6669 RepID=UPI001EDD13F8|nr:zinc finger and BTB domain-containing protein 18-like [Daphnia pulex]